MLKELRSLLLQVKIFPLSVALMADHLLLVSDVYLLHVIP